MSEHATPAEVEVQARFTPRGYQRRLLDAMNAGFRRAVWVVHRRGGKDRTAFNYMKDQALDRPGTYFFFYPTYAQGKKILWDGKLGPEDPIAPGSPFRHDIPRELVVSENETEMQVKVACIGRDGRKTGAESIIQIIGTDNMDSIVGTNPIGCVFSEYALQNPSAWDLVRPILRENGGWAIFIYTPRGRNHGWRLYEMARKPENRANWFSELLTVRDTRRDAEGESGAPVVTPAMIEEELREGMDPDLVQQEYFCSWTGALQGAYYGRQLDLARDEGRICTVAWDPARYVDTAWDIGIGDQNAIWFYQVVTPKTPAPGTYRINLIDYHETSGWGIEDYAKMLKEKPYAYNIHYGPHDLEHREWGSGRKRITTARELGIRFRVARKLAVDEGIAAVRRLFPTFWFDERKCEKGIDALASYHKEWDADHRCFKNTPQHDWSSHGADALRTLGVSFQEPRETRQRRAITSFNPMNYEFEFNPMEDPYHARRK